MSHSPEDSDEADEYYNKGASRARQEETSPKLVSRTDSAAVAAERRRAEEAEADRRWVAKQKEADEVRRAAAALNQKLRAGGTLPPKGRHSIRALENIALSQANVAASLAEQERRIAERGKRDRG